MLPPRSLLRAAVVRRAPSIRFQFWRRLAAGLSAKSSWSTGARQHGHSKYGLLRIPKGFLDLLTVKFLTGFGQRPQHLIGTAGLCFFGAGSIGIAILTALWVLTRAIPGMAELHLTERAIFYYCLGAALMGAQFISIGFIAELITSMHGRDSDTYSVAQRSGGEASWRSIDNRRSHRHRESDHLNADRTTDRDRTEAVTDPTSRSRKSDIPNR